MFVGNQIIKGVTNENWFCELPWAKLNGHLNIGHRITVVKILLKTFLSALKIIKFPVKQIKIRI